MVTEVDPVAEAAGIAAAAAVVVVVIVVVGAN